jgi:hypothetical protein
MRKSASDQLGRVMVGGLHQYGTDGNYHGSLGSPPIIPSSCWHLAQDGRCCLRPDGAQAVALLPDCGHGTHAVADGRRAQAGRQE